MLGNSEQESIALSVFCPQWRWAPIGGRGRWSRDTASAALQEGQQVEEEEEKGEEKGEEEEKEEKEGTKKHVGSFVYSCSHAKKYVTAS